MKVVWAQANLCHRGVRDDDTRGIGPEVMLSVELEALLSGGRANQLKHNFVACNLHEGLQGESRAIRLGEDPVIRFWIGSAVSYAD